MVYELRLFIAGDNETSKAMVSDLRDFFKTRLTDFSFKVFDIIEKPELAAKHGVLVTPLLEKESGKEKKRVFGDLSDKNKLLELVVP